MKNIMYGITNANTSGNVPQKAAHQKLNLFFFNFKFIDLNKALLQRAWDIISIINLRGCYLKILHVLISYCSKISTLFNSYIQLYITSVADNLFKNLFMLFFKELQYSWIWTHKAYFIFLKPQSSVYFLEYFSPCFIFVKAPVLLRICSVEYFPECILNIWVREFSKYNTPAFISWKINSSWTFCGEENIYFSILESLYV